MKRRPQCEYKLPPKEKCIFNAIRACARVSPWLRTPEERAKITPDSHPLSGHCFVATHAAYHLIGNRHNLVPHVCKLAGGGTHWWLWNRDTNKCLDATFEQTCQPFPYDQGKPCFWYIRRHKRPWRDKRTSELIHLVKERLKHQPA